MENLDRNMLIQIIGIHLLIEKLNMVDHLLPWLLISVNNK